MTGDEAGEGAGPGWAGPGSLSRWLFLACWAGRTHLNAPCGPGLQEAWVEAAVLLEAKLMVLSKGLDVRSKEMHPKAI